MKVQKAAFGIIKTNIDGTEKYLLRWNDKWNCFNLIGGKYEEEQDSDLFATAVRELEEELHLRFGADFEITRGTEHKVEMVQFSQREKIDKRYYFSLFPAKFKNHKTSLEIHSSDTANRWVNKNELKQGSTEDGRKISDTVRAILEKISEL